MIGGGADLGLFGPTKVCKYVFVDGVYICVGEDISLVLEQCEMITDICYLAYFTYITQVGLRSDCIDL